jgi:hypothetical protein
MKELVLLFALIGLNACAAMKKVPPPPPPPDLHTSK